VVWTPQEAAQASPVWTRLSAAQGPVV
jgi:hypothetical protein